jgi:hypothetical protein
MKAVANPGNGTAVRPAISYSVKWIVSAMQNPSSSYSVHWNSATVVVEPARAHRDTILQVVVVAPAGEPRHPATEPAVRVLGHQHERQRSPTGAVGEHTAREIAVGAGGVGHALTERARAPPPRQSSRGRGTCRGGSLELGIVGGEQGELAEQPA